jgi:Zn-dependent protease with chaperone function
VHLKKRHVIKQTFCMPAIYLVSRYGPILYERAVSSLLTKLQNKCEKHSRCHSMLETVKNVHSYVATSWPVQAIIFYQLSKWISRIFETDADLTAARTLGLQRALAGARFLEDKAQKYLSLRKEWPFAYIIDSCGNYLWDDEHPLFTERIAYLKAAAVGH